MVATSGTDTARALRPYLPRVAIRALAEAPAPHVALLPGTLVFADVSGFTKLSERLARLGAEGAERISEAIGTSFTSLLAVAYANGGSLLKFGGDALLLFFEGEEHAQRALRAAVGMRRALRAAGPVVAPGARTTLRMSMGVHSGTLALCLAGRSHREPVVAGPAVTTTLRMEKAASAGEIVLSPSLAATLPARLVGAPRGPGLLLRAAPRGPDFAPHEPPLPAGAPIAEGIPVAVRRHVLGGGGAPEHRLVTVAFVRYAGVDALVERAPVRGRRSARRAADGRPAGLRGARGRTALRRRRGRRREADARGGRAARGRRRGGADAAHAARDRRRRRLAPAPARRQPRPRVHRGHRAGLPEDVHRDGRRDQPRRAARGEGARRRDLRHGRRARALGAAVRPHPHPAAHAQGQGAPRRRVVRRRGARSRAQQRTAGAPDARGTRARARAAARRARGGARRRGALRRARRAAGHRQDAARRDDARRGRGADHPARDLRAARRRRPVRRLARAPAAADRRGLGRPADGGGRASAARPSPSGRTTSSRGSRCSPPRSAPSCPTRRPSPRCRPRSAPTGCTTRSSGSSPHRCPTPRCW